MVQRRSTFEIVGELLREGGLLVLVFGLLEKYARDDGGGPLSWKLKIVGLGLFGITLGTTIEARRQK